MSRRTAMRTLAALGVSAAAISTGAIVTSQAMAGASTPATGKVTVATVSADGGVAVQCEYDDIELPDLSEALPAAPSSALGASGVAVRITGGEGIDPDSAPTGEAGRVVVGRVDLFAPTDAEGAPAPMQSGELPGLTVNAATGVFAEARPGSAEECAAMRPTLAMPGVRAVAPSGAAATEPAGDN